MSRALGRYELLRPLARGGMAEVFLARRRAAGVEKWLVVKRMRPERAGDARFLDLFVREARLSMSLAHQNIVPVFDFGRIDDQVFLAMERIEGRDLGSTLARAGRPLPPLVAAFIAAECCQALDYAHRRRGADGAPLGIVHRDVTPRNVLLSWAGEVKLTDFGIAALAGDHPSKVIGTPAYMAPEQARGETLDARADVYAVGLVLREALTGVRARRGDDREELLGAARRGELASWPDDHVPETLRAIADKATAPDPAQRFADASDMLAELDAFMVGERAAAKGEAPARLLVGWLGEVWQEQRDEAGTSGELDEVGDHLVSFLDDGELDIVGTGTARSMLATAAEPEPAPTPSPTPAEPPKAAPGPAAPVKNAPTWWVPVAVVAVAGAVIAVFATEADTRPPPAPAVTPAIATTPPPKPPPAPQPKAPPVTEEVRPTPPPAPPPHAAPKAVVAKTRHVATPPPVDHPAAPAQQTFSLMVNTSPWSNFTIDGDPTKHTTIETVQLPAGPHRFHFWNEAAGMQRDVTIDVPAPDGKWVGSLTTSP